MKELFYVNVNRSNKVAIIQLLQQIQLTCMVLFPPLYDFRWYSSFAITNLLTKERSHATPIGFLNFGKPCFDKFRKPN